MISGFGLSAFLFSTAAHTFFPGNTSSFLFVLAIGTSLPMILGFLFIRPIPPPHVDPTGRLEDGSTDSPTVYGAGEGVLGTNSPTTYSHDNTSHTHLLARDVDEDEDEQVREPPIELEEEEPLVSSSAHEQFPSDYVVPGQVDSLALSPSREGFARHRAHGARSTSRRSARTRVDTAQDGQRNIHGKRLFKTADFWLLFTICSLCKSIYVPMRLI